MVGTCVHRHHFIGLTCTGRPGRLIGSFFFLFLEFWSQKSSGWLRTTLRIHLDQVSGQTVDSRSTSDQISCFWPRPELWSARIWAWLGFGRDPIALDETPLLLGGPTPCPRLQHLSCLNSRHLSCLSSRHLSCLNSRHLSCLNRRHLSCLNRRHNSSRPEAGSCSIFCSGKLWLRLGVRCTAGTH